MEAFPTSKPVIFVHADEDGGYLAHLPALPGCVARAQTAEAAVAAVRTLAPAYAALMRRAAFPVPDFTDAPVQETFTQVTLPVDQEPLAPAEIAAHLRLLAAARARTPGLAPPPRPQKGCLAPSCTRASPGRRAKSSAASWSTNASTWGRWRRFWAHTGGDEGVCVQGNIS
jgi:predicted RNase H-like HicB family nuclease